MKSMKQAYNQYENDSASAKVASYPGFYLKILPKDY